ncbi:hypothetical protein GGS23DRAFT_577202 [Durotheca rogersii]|uniref:uncharacterized protein n=1 Tax=Durotheca rogersii TaxID=419775 RepID=UPI00221FCA1B|nr:uncharacterized protein GGS23DRAFT_577202 [Durotheca rogersii]KAI5861143.1 hypothetical protein GGS23DRAFT_577202 [Durotheca rogersii]
MRSSACSVILGFLAYTPGLALLPRDRPGPVPLPNRLLHHWPNGTWVENISVRPNGNLLVTTSTPTGSVFHVKEPWKDDPEIELAYDFDEWVDRLIGIGETTPDTFVVVGSRFYAPDAVSSPVERTFCAMELDYSRNPEKPTARLIAWFPEAYLLQSVAALPWDPTTVLISDQYLLKPRQNQTDWSPSPGQVWRLDTRTGEHSLVMTDYVEFNSTGLKGPDTGINGVKVRENYFYWVNLDTGYVYRLKIDKKGVPVPPGKPETLAYYDTLWDDFAFGPGNKDTIWATGRNAVFAISPKGEVVSVVGVGTSDNLTFPGPTASAFGRHSNDKNILYVTGNLINFPENPLDGILGGWIRAVDTTGFHF